MCGQMAGDKLGEKRKLEKTQEEPPAEGTQINIQHYGVASSCRRSSSQTLSNFVQVFLANMSVFVRELFAVVQQTKPAVADDDDKG